MLATDPAPASESAPACESCGQPLASEFTRCPVCSDRPVAPAPIGRA